MSLGNPSDGAPPRQTTQPPRRSDLPVFLAAVRLLRRRAVIISSLVFLFAGFAIIQYLNFSGFCYRDMRYLSDNELIESAIRYNIQHPHSAPDLIEYTSIDEFHRLNPDCCRVYRDGHYTLTEGTWPRFYGWYISVAEVWYRRKQFGPDPYYRSYVAVNACGRAMSRHGPFESRGPDNPRQE
jgi:hypothetical protein